MSTVNEQAQPNPGDQPSPADAAAAAATEQKPLTVTEEVTDPDLIELRDAKAAAEVEEAAAKTPAAETVNGNAAPAPAATPPTDQTPAPIGEAKMIPKPRFDEAVGKAKEEAAYWRGVAEARAPGQAPAQQQHTAQPTVEQRLAEIDTAMDAVAKKFDDGEITAVELTKQQRELQRREQAIREDSKPKAQPASEGGDALYLETKTAELEKAHPWVGVFDQVASEADWTYLKNTAVERLTARGIDPTAGTIGKYHLRAEVAALADELGPALLTKRAQTKGVALPGQISQAPAPQGGKPPLTPQAQNRLDKLQQQSSAPPNLAAMQGTSDSGVPDSSVENMSDDEIAALPEATRKRILSKTA